MSTYRVRPGFTFGAFDQFGPGDVVELTAAEAAGFLDKLEQLPDAPPFAPADEPQPSEESAPAADEPQQPGDGKKRKG